MLQIGEAASIRGYGFFWMSPVHKSSEEDEEEEDEEGLTLWKQSVKSIENATAGVLNSNTQWGEL